MEHFYGKEIDRNHEQLLIEKMLSKYRFEPVSEELKKIIHKELAAAKERGEITIPFKVVMHSSNSPTHQAYIEVILDSKV